jgi:hypothetical protein
MTGGCCSRSTGASGARCQIVVPAHLTKAGHLSGSIVISLSGAVYGTFATETIHLAGMGTANSIGPKPPYGAALDPRVEVGGP